MLLACERAQRDNPKATLLLCLSALKTARSIYMICMFYTASKTRDYSVSLTLKKLAE